MRIPLGELREPVIIRSPTVVTDEAGGESVTYTESPQTWAAIRPASAKEGREQQQMNASSTHILFGHWQDFSRVTSEDRIRNLDTGEEFDIVGPPLNNPARDHTKLNLLLRENV